MAPTEARALIVSAAREVFVRDRQANLDDVARAAGVSRATVYRLFGSRDEVLRQAGLEPDRDSRERVLEAALELVGRDGLSRMSMDELAAAAGLSRASLYRLFPGKPALFRELVSAFSPLEAVLAVVEHSRQLPPEELMPEIARRVARQLEGRTGIVRSLLFELLSVTPDSREAADWAWFRAVTTLAGYLVEQMEAGRLRAMDPVLAMTGFIGPVLLHLVSRPLLELELGYGVRVEDAVTELAENWLRSMRPD